LDELCDASHGRVEIPHGHVFHLEDLEKISGSNRINQEHVSKVLEPKNVKIFFQKSMKTHNKIHTSSINFKAHESIENHDKTSAYARNHA